MVTWIVNLMVEEIVKMTDSYQVFLQEFKDARKAHQQAPQVLFSYGEPPAELNGQPGLLRGDNIG